MFFFFAVNGVLYFVTSCFIPETKGKSLEELETLFDKEVVAKPRMHDVARPPRPCHKGEGALATAGFATGSKKTKS
jgi:hypothetical protein